MQPEVRLLGRGTVMAQDRVVDTSAWRTAKTYDLLRVLALSGGRPVPVDTLVELFWPFADPVRGGTSLRTATCQIRKVLGNDSVRRVGHALQLDAWVDVAAYRSLARQVEEAREAGLPARVVALAREAEALYDGDVDVAGTECTALHEAHRELRELRAQLLLEAAEAAGRCGSWRESVAFAQRTSALQTSDRATRALMRGWFAVGETAKPVEEFERLRHHLADEYGVDPAPQTRALYLEVVGACAEWPPRETVVGRAKEIGQVASSTTSWLMDPDGATGIVWLVGEPGSGRETVAREAVRKLMLTLGREVVEAGTGATVELLPDQGALTKGLAAMLRLRAETWGRIMIVPVSQVAVGALGEGDTIVPVRPLQRADFRRLLALTLQGSPSEQLEHELHEESGGLPGLACRLARHRLGTGDLTWTLDGVDTARPSRTWRRSLLGPLAALPFALMGLLGAQGVADTDLVEAAIHRGPCPQATAV